MTRFKDFGKGNDSAPKDPISFKLHEEEFSCKTALQGKVLLGLVAGTSSDDAAKAASTISDFFDYVLLEESKEAFNALLVDPDRIVSVETLSEIVAWLIAEYTDRPNPQPEV
jgi:hypothetical protein